MAFIPLGGPLGDSLEVGDILVLRDDLDYDGRGLFTAGHRFVLVRNKVSETYSVFILVDIEGRKIILDQEALDGLDPTIIKTYPYAGIRKAG